MIDLFEKIIVFVLITIALVSFILWIQFRFSLAPNLGSRSPQPTAIIGKTKIKLELADTPAKHYQGLSYRDSLCHNCGMLFVWRDANGQVEARPRIFVMRNMKFSLDIIWIKDGRIIKISQKLAPEGAKPQHLYKSGQAVDYVLEVNGGFCDKNNIKIGDKVILNL